jgi:MFS family permease
VQRWLAVRFLTGIGVSGLGDWLTTYALAVVLYGSTGSVAATAGYFLVRVGPRPLGAWLGGPIGDLVSPRLSLVGAALLQGALTACLAIPLAAGRSLLAIYLLVGLSQLVGGSWQPLTSATMARLAHGRDRHGLNLAYIFLGGASIVISPAVGALLLPVLGAVPLVLTDAVSFGLAATLFLSVPAMPGGATRELTVRGAALGGFAAILPRRTLRIICSGVFGQTVAITALQTALPALAVERLGSADAAGFLYAVVGLGSMAGSLLALWRPVQRSRIILPGDAIAIAGIGVVVLVGSAALDLLVLAASTATSSLAQVEGGVVIQNQPRQIVGRIQGAVSTSRFIGMTAGAAIALAVAAGGSERWQVLVPLLAAVGLVILVVASLGGGRAGEALESHAGPSPLADLAE